MSNTAANPINIQNGPTFYTACKEGRPPIEITEVAHESITLMTEYLWDEKETAPARTPPTFELALPQSGPYPMNIDDLFKKVDPEVEERVLDDGTRVVDFHFEIGATNSDPAPAQRRLSRSALGAISGAATAALTLFSASILRFQAMYGSLIRF